MQSSEIEKFTFCAIELEIESLLHEIDSISMEETTKEEIKGMITDYIRWSVIPKLVEVIPELNRMMES